MRTLDFGIAMRLLLLTFLLPFTSCKKDEIIEEMEPEIPGLEIDKENLLAALSNPDVINFFDSDFLEQSNPNFANGPIGGALEPEIEQVYLDFLIKNGELNYVPDILPNVAYPLWRRARVFNTLSENTDVIVIPFTSPEGTNTETIMVAIPDSNDPFYEERNVAMSGYYYLTMTRAALSEALENLDTATENTYSFLYYFLVFDEDVFDVRNESWWQIWEDYDDGFQEDIVTPRDLCEIIVTDCIPLAFGPDSEIEERDCLVVSMTLTYECNNGGGTIPGGWTPGGGISTGGNGLGWGGGIYGISPEQSELNRLIASCSSETSPDVIVDNPEHSGNEAGCSALLAAIENLGINSFPPDIWVLLFEQYPELLDIAAEAAPSVHESFRAYTFFVVSGATTQPFRTFDINFTAAMQLQSILELDESTFQWLIQQALSVGEGEPSMATEALDFLEEYEGDELATAYVMFLLAEYQELGDISLDLVNPFEEYVNNLAILEHIAAPDQTEIENGIDILESYLYAIPQIPSGIPFGGSEINPNGGPDLEFGTDGDLSILTPENQEDATLPVHIQERRLKRLFFMGTIFSADGEVVADDYLEQFHENDEVFDHYNATLSTMVMNSTKMRNWLKDYGNELNNKLIITGGDIDGIDIPEIDRTSLNETNAMIILINDTQKINMARLDSYNFNAQTGEWDCYFVVNVVDHFGLDDQDVIDFQDHGFGVSGNGFIAWWALQHRYGWAPFRTDIWFVVKLGGKI